MLFRSVRVMNLILILSRRFSIQRRGHFIDDFIRKKKSFNIGLRSHIFMPISFKRGVVMNTIAFYLVISV